MTTRADSAPIPVYLNMLAGSARAVAERLRDHGRFAIRETTPAELEQTIRADAARGSKRVVVCGGDGTVGLAAAIAAELGLELAIIPGGTLNHFAKRLGIPLPVDEALDVAGGAHVRSVDVGFLGERLFLNTSAVGAYVTYVRLRERAEGWLGYTIGSAVAALRLLFRLGSSHVRLEAEGDAKTYSSRLVFVGVGERKMSAPRFGEPVRGGERELHVVVVDGSASARHLVRALAAAARGLDTAHRTPGISSHLVSDVVVELPLPTARVALDGELHRLRTPLRYRIARDALRVVVPAIEERRSE